MKLSAVVVTRNDDYGGNLNDRAIYCLNSLINTFDEVILLIGIHLIINHNFGILDKNNKFYFKGNLKHIVINS